MSDDVQALFDEEPEFDDSPASSQRRRDELQRSLADDPPVNTTVETLTVPKRRLAKTARDLARALEVLGWEDVRWNKRACQIELKSEFSTEHPGDWAPLTNLVAHKIREDIAETFMSPRSDRLQFGRDTWEQSINALAAENQVDPFVAWLENLPEWDGEARLDSLLVQALGAPDNLMSQRAGEILIIGAVRRSMRPGCVHRLVPTLVGPQDIGKSQFCHALFPVSWRNAWHGESASLSADHKYIVESLLGKVVIEFAELEGLRRAETSKLKALISANKDHIRLAYARLTEDHLRRCVFIGTANDHGYGVLPDDKTGNSRWIGVPVTGFGGHGKQGITGMLDWLDERRDQLWAEGLARYQAGEVSWFTTALEVQAQAESTEPLRMRDEALESEIHGYIEAMSEVSIATIMSDLPDRVTRGRSPTGLSMQIADILKGAGWFRERIQRDGARRSRWIRG